MSRLTVWEKGDEGDIWAYEGQGNREVENAI